MRSRDILLMLAVWLFAAGAQAEEGTTVDEYICLRCEDLVPNAIGKKALAGRNAEPLAPKTCDAECVYKGVPRVAVISECGSQAERRRRQPLLSGRQPLPELGDRGYTVKSAEDFFLAFWDKDTPCMVGIRWDSSDPAAEVNAIGLGREVAKALTPEVIAKRRTVEAIVWAQDETGERAKAALAAWDKDGAAMKALVNFAPGFPKTIDHKDRAGLPPGKKSLLLGYCPNKEGRLAVELLGVGLPGVEWHRVEAKDAPLSCPAPPRELSGSPEVKRKRMDKLELSVLSVRQGESKGKASPLTLVHAYLRDEAGKLVDFAKTEIIDSGCDGGTLKGTKFGVTVRVVCVQGSVHDYPRCEEDPVITHTTRIGVKDGKLTMTTTESPRPECTFPDD